MPSLSDEDLVRLQAAIRTNDPARLLACLMILLPCERSGNFVEAVATLGNHDAQRAEQLYRAAIALYEKYFPDEHSGGLSAMCALARLLDEQNREPDISQFLDEAYPLVLRAAKGIGKNYAKRQH